MSDVLVVAIEFLATRIYSPANSELERPMLSLKSTGTNNCQTKTADEQNILDLYEKYCAPICCSPISPVLFVDSRSATVQGGRRGSRVPGFQGSRVPGLGFRVQGFAAKLSSP
eukprot:1540561-Heterocapsa_arctica.AAC.1